MCLRCDFCFRLGCVGICCGRLWLDLCLLFVLLCWGDGFCWFGGFRFAWALLIAFVSALLIVLVGMILLLCGFAGD